MNLRQRTFWTGLLIGVYWITGWPQEETRSDSVYLRLLTEPYLQQTTQTGTVIMWETNLPATSTIEYGDRVPLQQKVEDPNLTTIHELKLQGLTAQSNYFYRVISRNKRGDLAASAVYQFQSAVRSESPFAFVVIGDTRTYPGRFRRIARRVYRERPNFVLHVGDVVSDGEKKNQWLEEYLGPASVFMKHLPTYVAIGNHEKNSHWFYDYVSYPPPEDYYTFQYGNAEFFIVDTNVPFEPRSPQYRWLDSALAASRARWKFVAHHHPPYSSDKDDYGDTAREQSVLGDVKVRTLTALYEKYHVDIVWVGHIHTYERTWPIKKDRINLKQGVIYIQTGGGGAELEEFAPTRSWFTAKLNRNWEYCLVTIHGGILRMMAYDIQGRLFDFLELKK